MAKIERFEDLHCWQKGRQLANVIYDLTSGGIADPAALGGALKSITGVVDHGLFLDLADEALIGTDQGVVKLTP